MPRRAFALASMFFGGVGVVLSIVVIVGVWLVGERLVQATSRTCEVVDEGLVVVKQRAASIEERFESTRLRVEGMRRSFARDRHRDAVRPRDERIDLEALGAQLVRALERTDRALEVLESAIEVADRVQAFAATAGYDASLLSTDDILAEIASSRIRLQEIEDSVDQIATGRRAIGEVVSAEPLVKLDRFAGEALATCQAMQDRVALFGEATSKARRDVGRFNTVARRWIRFTAIMITLLSLWMAAGQVALIRLGWSRERGERFTGRTGRGRRTE